MARVSFSWKKHMIHHIVNLMNILAYHANDERIRNNSVWIGQERDRSLYSVKGFSLLIIKIVEASVWKVANVSKLFKSHPNLMFFHFISKNTVYVVEVSIKHPLQIRKALFRYFTDEALQTCLYKILDKNTIFEILLIRVVKIKKLPFYIVTIEVVFLILK